MADIKDLPFYFSISYFSSRRDIYVFFGLICCLICFSMMKFFRLIVNCLIIGQYPSFSLASR